MDTHGFDRGKALVVGVFSPSKQPKDPHVGTIHGAVAI
jgi:hypothetical protein